MRFRNYLVLLLLLALVLQDAAAKKKININLLKHPAERAEIKDLDPDVPVAKQKCPNWSWAAALQALLARQGVREYKQDYWIMKLNGGELCMDSVGAPDDLIKVVNGEYVLDDGRHVRLNLHYFPGAPTDMDGVIARVRRGQSLILFWKGQAFLAQGITYDEYIYPSGEHMFEARQIDLIDPMAAPGKRAITFIKGSDDAGDMTGSMDITVTLIEQQPWQR